MTVLPTRLPGLVLFEPRVFGDSRGWFFEAFHAGRYCGAGLAGPFVQDNVSWSGPGVLRGLHLQSPNPQGKLVQVLAGAVWDVAVDIRFGSPTFGEWEAFELSAENHRQFYIPPGFAHGFAVLSAPAMMTYKCTAYYDPAAEVTLRYDDPTVGVNWPVTDELELSGKDRLGIALADLPVERLIPFV